MNEILEVAEKAARRAGQIMLTTSGKISDIKTKSNAADLVTESDIQCQSLIKEIILKHFPNDSFLGEEDVDAGSVASVNALEGMLSIQMKEKGSNDSKDNGDMGEVLIEEERMLWIVDPIGEFDIVQHNIIAIHISADISHYLH